MLTISSSDDAHRGIALLEELDHLGELVLDDSAVRGNRNIPHETASQSVQALLHILDAGHDPVDVGQNLLAVLGQDDAPAVPLVQLDAHHLLEGLNLV